MATKQAARRLELRRVRVALAVMHDTRDRAVDHAFTKTENVDYFRLLAREAELVGASTAAST